MGLAVAACTNAKPAADGEGDVTEAPKVKTSKDYLPSKAEKDSVSYLIGVNFGSFLKGYNFGDDLNYSEMVKGMKDFLAAEGDFRSPEFGKQFKHNPQYMDNALNSFLKKRQNYVSAVNKEKEDKFFASNAKKANVVTTESGLQYELIEAGNDVHPTVKDTVWVRYKGTLVDGTVFDQTEEGGEPIDFVLSRVVRGWQEGLQLLGEGGKAKLYIPSSLGYGEQGTQNIEPNSTLIFDVELVKVGKVE